MFTPFIFRDACKQNLIIVVTGCPEGNPSLGFELISVLHQKEGDIGKSIPIIYGGQPPLMVLTQECHPVAKVAMIVGQAILPFEPQLK